MAKHSHYFMVNGDRAIHLHSENDTPYKLDVENDGTLNVTNEETGKKIPVGTGGGTGEGGGGLPTGGDPNMMLVTDADGNAKWDERTHYVEEVEADIYPETTVAGEEGQFVVAEPYAFYPTAGGTYTVTFVSGETTDSFNCVATEFDLEGLPAVALGNIGALTGGGDTGEPFVLFFIQEDVASGAGMYALIMLLSGAATEITFSVSGMVESVHMIDEKYIPKFGASSLANGSGFASVRNFFGYVEDETYQMGDYAFSWRGRATGETSLAWSGTASGDRSVSFGEEASGIYSFAANGGYATGFQSFAANNGKASGDQSFAEGFSAEAKGDRSHAEGYMTIAASGSQHVQGEFNIEDTENKYAHIVGNGANKNARSNAHTLDWDGNAWYAGNVYVGGTKQSEGQKLVTQSELNAAIAGGGTGGGGESCLFIINITPTEDGGSFTSDKTLEDITAALNAGKWPVICEPNESGAFMYSHMYGHMPGYAAMFSFFEGTMMYTYMISVEGNIRNAREF